MKQIYHKYNVLEKDGHIKVMDVCLEIVLHLISVGVSGFIDNYV